MAMEFKEVAHLRTDKKKFDENYDKIFGKKKEKKAEPTNTEFDTGYKYGVDESMGEIKRLRKENEELRKALKEIDKG